jgi:hypothetical protein
MLIVRFVLIILFIPAFIVIARSLGSRSRALRSLLLFSFPSLVGFSIVFPRTWQSMADIVGIDRGADLLLYVTVLTLVTYIGYSFGKFRYLEKRIATLVQELTLLRAAQENLKP